MMDINTVKWVSNGLDCCCIGFLPHSYITWSGETLRWHIVVEVFEPNDPVTAQPRQVI